MSDKLGIDDHIDHQRWLLDHGFINDLHKDNLYMYGAIIHRDIAAVEIEINCDKKTVGYCIYCDRKLLRKLDKYERLSKSRSVLGLWRFKRLLKKEGNLNFKRLLDNFVKDYCGPKWAVELELKDYREYKDGFEELPQEAENTEANQQPNE